jgi:hypothetical protein
MKPLHGRLLSQKNSARLSMLDFVGREKLIEAIVSRIRKSARDRKNRQEESS